MPKTFRLPRNFHKTFKPERQYINTMLQYVAAGKSGDFQEIAKETGIPMGKSSGKVPAILDYCRGMGLVHLDTSVRSAVKNMELTPFGRAVLFEDPFLKLEITQWLAHFNMCSPLYGAEVWYQSFFPGRQALGMEFKREQLETFLQAALNTDTSGLIGPLVGTYEDEAALGACGVLSESSNIITRLTAPISEEFCAGYGAWLMQLMSDHLPKNKQISVIELDTVAGWRTIPGWSVSDQHKVLQMIESKGLLSIDRHMEPWLLQPCANLEEAWELIYDDLI